MQVRQKSEACESFQPCGFPLAAKDFLLYAHLHANEKDNDYNECRAKQSILRLVKLINGLKQNDNEKEKGATHVLFFWWL